MEQLIVMLQDIQELLNQVLHITENQQSILVQANKGDVNLEILEEMASYKESMTTEIEQKEAVFQVQYDKFKDHIAKTDLGKVMRTYVEGILKLKEHIIQVEQRNVMLLKEKIKACATPMSIQPIASQVTQAYKLQDAYGKQKR